MQKYEQVWKNVKFEIMASTFKCDIGIAHH